MAQNNWLDEGSTPVPQPTSAAADTSWLDEQSDVAQDNALVRGFKKSSQSIGITKGLVTGDSADTARKVAEAADYARKNPGMQEGRELGQAWDRGDGVWGGIKEVAGEFAKDWRDAPGAIAGVRATGRNLRAMGENMVEQLPNMAAPVAGMIAGGAAGSAAAGPVGTVLGGWAGASLGNTAVEGGSMVQEALQKDKINPTDQAAVRAYLDKNGDRILGQAGVKGAIIGAVDTATAGLGHFLLSGPGKAAASRALADMGVDAADKAAVRAAQSSAEFKNRIASDAAYQATQQGANKIARNAGAAALEPAGEFAGEFVGQGVATGEWDAKNAALEAASSIGQSGAMYAGQKAIQAFSRPGAATNDPNAQPAPAQDEFTTSPGAADPNAPQQPQAAPPEAPDLTTSPGAGVARDGMDFTRDVDTSGLSLQDPAEIERAKAATVDYQPADTTPQWDTQLGATGQRQGLDMPAPEIDTAGLGLDPIRQMVKQAADAGGALSAAAGVALDVAASNAQFIGATGRELQPRRTGPGVTNESNVIDVQGRVIEDPAIGTPRRLTDQQDGMAARALGDSLANQPSRTSSAVPALGGPVGDDRAGGPATAVPDGSSNGGRSGGRSATGPGNPESGAAQSGGRGNSNQALSQPALPAPSNLREAIDRIRQERAQLLSTQGATSESQASQTQQGSTQQPQAGGPQAGPAAAPSAANTGAAGGNRVQAAGLTDGAPTANLGAQAAPAGGTQGKAPRAAAEQLTAAQERWQRMTTAERQAVAARTDVKPILRKNLHGAKWENLNVDVQRKLQGAMEPIEAQPSDMKAFKPETGTLGVPRSEMPQVPSQSHGGLVKHLNSQGISHETTTVDAGSLKPTQAEYSPAKVEAAKSAEGGRAVIVSKDGHIIDGHHQAMAAAEEGKTVKAIVLDAPVERALEAVKNSPSAQKNEPNQAPALDVKEPEAIKNVAEQAAPKPEPAPVRLGRNNAPLNEGGKPFKTRKAAGDAKKLQPMMRVVTVPGGYALAEKTPAQLAAEERASRRLRNPNTSARGEPIPAHAFVAAAGGLNPVAASDLGVDGNPRIGNRRLFSRQGRGLSMDQATQMLIQDGYLSEGASINDALALIKTSLTRPQYNADGIERIAEAEVQAQFEDYLAAQEEASAEGDADPFGMADEFTAEELDEVGYTDADPALQAEVAALIAQAEAIGIDTHAILEDIARTYANATQDQYNAAARDALAQAIARSNQDGGSTAAQAAPASESAADQGLDPTPALELASQTPAEAAAQQDAQEQATKAEAAAKRAEDAAAKAEDERKRIAQASVRAADSFELGQDPLDSLTGQGSIFDAPEPAPAPQPITRADVAAAKQQAATLIAERIDAMTAGEVNTIARRFLPTMGVKPTVSKERNKAAVTDFTKVNPIAAADEFGVKLPADVRRALDAEMQGKVADAQPAVTYINGDRAEYTGNTETISGGLFYEVRFTEGAKNGKTAVTQRAPDGANPGQRGPVEPTGIVTPQLSGNPAQFIKIAADSIKALRKVDVDRVLTETPAAFRQEVAAYIRDQRKDLADEVDDVMADLAGAKQEADEQQARADNRKKVETKEDDTGNVVKFSRGPATEVRNLVTLHNLTEDNLRYADSLGGIPVPSIGITKVDSPFGGFGNITLIASKDMIDPKAGVPVYDRDAWTARFPTMNFKKVKAKLADAFYDRVKPVREMMAGDDGGFVSALWEQVRNASVQSPEKVIDIFTRYEAGRVLYAKEVLGKSIKVPMRNVRPSMPSGHDAQLVAYWKTHGAALMRSEHELSGAEFANTPENKAFEEEVRASIRRYAEAVGEPEKADSYISTAMPDGTLGAGLRDRWIRDIKTAGTKEIDRTKLAEAVDKAVKPDDPGYLRWVESLVQPLFEAPTITLRGKEVPATLDNIVDAMTVGTTAGAEKSMTFSAGKAAAMLGKRFKSMDEIKAARDQVVSPQAEAEGKKSSDALLAAYRSHVSQFYTGKDWRGNIDTWAANDDAMEALAKAGKAASSDANIRAALTRMGFKGVDQQALDMARDAIDALRNAATDYFEAKPQRAVKLNEFKGAVVPKGTNPEAIAILEKHGIAVELYSKTEGAREKAIQKLAKRLDKESGGVLFSFAGQQAATADTMALATAQQRLEAGEDAEAVRRDTGWFRGADGKWRFEINDADARLKDRAQWTAKIDGINAKRDAALQALWQAKEQRNDFLRARGESPSRISSETKKTPEFKALAKALKNAEAAAEKAQDAAFLARQGDSLITVGDVLSHPALFAAYPGIANVRVDINDSLPAGNAAYAYELRAIELSGKSDAQQLLSTLLHEIQHGIQHIEGFAMGDSPERLAKTMPDAQAINDAKLLAKFMERGESAFDARQRFMRYMGRDPNPQGVYLAERNEPKEIARMASTPLDAYKRNAGEVEARNTQARQGMTAAERRATAPSQTADVADADVIVVFNGKEMANAPMPTNTVPDAAATAQPLRTPAATIRAAITKAYGNLLGQLESKGLVTLTQTQEQAIEAAAQARADKTGGDVAQIRQSLMAAVKRSIASDGDVSEQIYQEIAADEDVIDALELWMVDGKEPDSETNRKLLSYMGRMPAIPADSYLTFYRGQPVGVRPHKRGWASWTTSRDTTRNFIGRNGEVLERKGVQGVSLEQIALWRTRLTGELHDYGSQGEWIVLNDSAFGASPSTIDIRRSANGAVQGFFDPQTGQSFLIADNLSAEAAPGVLMHEVGIHMAADGSMKALFNRAAMMLKMQRGNPFMKAVHARMDAAGETSGEEAAAYIAEAYENDRANAPASVQRWLADLLAAVKAWMFKKGIMGADRLTVADIAAVARANARSMARDGGATGGQGFGAAFSRAPAGDQTQTEAFKRWFKNSKVVDAQGKPLVVYHGTKGKFTVFEMGRTTKNFGFAEYETSREGAFFTPDKDFANEFSGKVGEVMAVYLSIQKPLDLSEGYPNDFYIKHGKMLSENNLSRMQPDEMWEMLDAGFPGSEEFIAAVKDDGYDGLKMMERDGDSSAQDVYVAFRPEQVKSATGNNGTFDPTNPDIRFSRAATTVAADYTPTQQAAAEKAFGTIAKQTLAERAQAFRANMGTKLRQGLVDQFAPIKEVSQQAYMLARMSKGSDGAVEAALLYGKPFLRDGVTDVNMQDGGFANVLASLKGEHDRFFQWVAAQRAERLKAEGKENLLTDTDIAALRSLNAGKMADGTVRMPLYAKALQELNAFNEASLKVALESGLIDQAAYDLMRDQPYVPFYRLMEEGDMRGPRFSSGLTNQQAWKKLKGGTQQLNADLLQNTLLNWSHLYAAAARNRAALATMTEAENLGIAYQVPADTKGSTKVMRDGVAEHWMVEDPYLLEAISALNYTPGGIAKALAPFKRLLTFGVTVNPTFKIRNLIRDSLSAIAQSDLSYNPAENVAKGWKATSKGSQTYASMLASGGIIKFGTQENTNHLRGQIERLGGTMLDKQGWEKFTGQMRSLWETYEEFGDRTENVNRAALYERLRAKGLSHAEASFQARDLMDFSMSGKWEVVRFLTQTVPFLNARLQGLYKLGRAAKEDPRRFAAMAGAVSMASLALLAAYSDDEDWKKREDWDRDNFWWFKVGEMAFRIPKPFEVGAIGTVAERTAELMLSDEMTGKRFGQRISDMVFNTFAMDPTPQAIKPFLDVYANKDSFSGRAIEGMADERLRPQDRYNERTSEVARLLGSWGLPDPVRLAKGEYAGLSPKQIDFLLRGYFGWLATVSTTATDVVAKPLLGRGERPEAKLRDAFLAGNFVESLPSGSSRYVTAMYEQARDVEQAWASYQAAIKSGDIDKAREIQQDEAPKLRNRMALENAKSQISDLNARAKRIESDKLMSAQAKRAKLDEIEALRNRVAERVAVRN